MVFSILFELLNRMDAIVVFVLCLIMFLAHTLKGLSECSYMIVCVCRRGGGEGGH